MTLNTSVTDAIDQAKAELTALSNRLLMLATEIGDNTNALFALDDARKCIAESKHDLQRVKTRLTEPAPQPDQAYPRSMMRGDFN